MRGRVFLLAIVTYVAQPSCLGGPSQSLSEPFQRLAYEVVDAAYSQSLDRLVMVSAGPPILHFYEPFSGTEQQVPLAADPTCVGLSPDGNFAAVGHASFISYVDLNAGTVLQTYPVSAPVRNLVVTDNGYIYAQWNRASLPPSQQMSVVNIATGVEQIVSNGGTQARQRPGLETLYVNDLHTNPEGRFDLDITGGGASPAPLAPLTSPPIRSAATFGSPRTANGSSRPVGTLSAPPRAETRT